MGKKIEKLRGSHVFPSEIICLTVPKIFVKNTSMFQKKLEFRKVLCIMGFCQDFPSKIFSFTVPRNFVGEPFCCVSENFLYGRKYEKEGGIMIFYREFSVSHNEEIRGGSLCVRKIPGMVKSFE